MRIPYISLLAAGALALGGCAYDNYGYGYGPYSGLSVGVGYGSGYYGGYGGYGGYHSGPIGRAAARSTSITQERPGAAPTGTATRIAAITSRRGGAGSARSR